MYRYICILKLNPIFFRAQSNFSYPKIFMHSNYPDSPYSRSVNVIWIEINRCTLTDDLIYDFARARTCASAFSRTIEVGVLPYVSDDKDIFLRGALLPSAFR